MVLTPDGRAIEKALATLNERGINVVETEEAEADEKEEETREEKPSGPNGLCGRSVRDARSKVAPPPERSGPAQNARPAPVTITALIASSLSARSNASIISCSICVVNALSLSGRLSVIVRIDSSTSYRTVS